MALDHTMPLAYLYRLDETATCLCSNHNSQKSDHFPVDYYSEEELVRLSKITGLSLTQLHKKEVNQQVLNLLIENVVWFYDAFLMQSDYQSVSRLHRFVFHFRCKIVIGQGLLSNRSHLLFLPLLL